MLEVPLGFTELGAALITTLAGVPAVKLTVVVLVKPEIVAETFAVKTWLPALRVTLAMPVASVAAVAPESVPAVVLNATVAFGTTRPLLSNTRARITVLPLLTGMLPFVAVVVTEPITVALVFTVMVVVLITPVLVLALIVSLPTLVPAV